jgi:hypothetical protein
MIPIEISFDRYFEKFSGNDRFTFVRFTDRGHNHVFSSEARFQYVEEYNIGAEEYRISVGTMTEEIFGSSWVDNVIALAIENSDMELTQSATESIICRVVFGGSVASQRKDNSNFTFAVESGTSATVDEEGVVTASSTVTGDTVISVTLTDKPDIVAYMTVSVSNA